MAKKETSKSKSSYNSGKKNTTEAKKVDAKKKTTCKESNEKAPKKTDTAKGDYNGKKCILVQELVNITLIKTNIKRAFKTKKLSMNKLNFPKINFWTVFFYADLIVC